MVALRFGVLYSTSDTIANVEDWLERNCKGAFDVRLEGMADDLSSKKLGLYFELDTDRAFFKANYHTKRMAG